MKKNILISSVFIFVFLARGFAQVQKHIKWQTSLSKTAPAVGETVELILVANIDKGWHLYSSDFDPNVGPIVTTIKFVNANGFVPVGKFKSVKATRKHDDIFDGEVAFFEGTGEFRQEIKITKPNPKVLVEVRYQTCQDDGSCVPGDDNFTFDIPTNGTAVAVPAQDTAKKKTELLTSVIADTVKDSGITSFPIVPFTAKTSSGDASLWAFFLAAFLSGLVALLTPCVFPMIPMTVSYFTSGSTSRRQGIFRALLYGFFIVAIYTVIGTVVARINGPAFANFVSTHWLPNVLFFVIFILFGLSFLGWFELVLPHWLVNKADQQAEKGGISGIFFMAFTLALVSFSCTGPIVGSVLVASAGGQVLKPIVGMVGFSAAFALPFTLFAIFPQWLKTLPKSGGWLNTVKVVLGFLELALALKFLSVADQVYHWRILDREIYLSLWIVIFGLLGLYLLGKIRLPHDSPTDKVSIPRLLFAIASLSFTVYMIPGMWGAPLKFLAGFLPPTTTQDFVLGSTTENTTKQNALMEIPKYATLFHFPHGLQGFFDYTQALAYAKKVNKPLFIDFTGHGCVNCRKMEENVWTSPDVLKHLQNDFVLVALYVDDKTELPMAEHYVSSYDNKPKTSIGDQNADLQITKFNNNAQPYYCLTDSEGNLLMPPQSYQTNVSEFVDFLEQGLEQFNN